ncbi:SIMPL domain-containing protein [Massilia sp. KIM]|uniref:SIMPL domain-containing protein n=1 Tax=Massilia sp. KIM TaxID=1955422 RepID=UPI00098FAB2C|nr:SIMPL domain-containing protein [Massilia sp. KIM]OON62100.1 SIMPL domain-containing protein [Massilia sp. KIM]
MSLAKPSLLIALLFAAQAYAQSPAPATAGTLVIVPAFGEVKHANDQAIVTFAVEEHDKDKAKAAERVNRKMKEGTEILRKLDPRAEYKTMGYYTYPIYPENVQPPRPVDGVVKPPVPVAWRVGQYLEMKTTSLAELPKTAASAQKVLTINNIQFGLAPATEKRLDDQRIAETYKNLNERIVSIANAMGRKPAEAVIDTVDFEGSGNYVNGGGDAAAAAPMMARMSAKREMADSVSEPSFEPGETTLQMRLVGKVKFK